jgi:hypothetical protein
MIDFAKIDKQTFTCLAGKGRINPHCNQFIEIGMVFDGRKPAALLAETYAWFATNQDHTRGYLKMQRVPHLARLKPNHAKYVIYRHLEHFDAVCAAWDLYPYKIEDGRVFDERTVKFDIALGTSLGYTDTDIARYLEKNYGFKTMKKGLQSNAAS